MPVPYAPQTWTNGSGGGTPLSAGRLQHMESGIDAISNERRVFRGTGSEMASFISDGYAALADVWFCTSTGSGYTAGFTYRYSGSVWAVWEVAPATYTPGVAGASFSSTSIYRSVAAGMCRVVGTMTLSAALTGEVYLNTPSGLNIAISSTSVLGTMTFEDVGSSVYGGFVRRNGSNSVLLKVWNASSTYLSQAALSGTVPFTSASGDVLSVEFEYPVA